MSMNADEKLDRIDSRIDAIQQWQSQHEMADHNEFHAIQERLDRVVTLENFEKTIDDAFRKYLLTKGGKIKTSVITVAMFLGGVVAIGTFIKTMLAWIGISIIRG